MIIKKIILENIRSYQNLELNFREGSTLLSGDIGSGKTSILLAMEFALFGLQPGQRGSSLLRNGSDNGKVFLEIELDNKIIGLERTLKRGKTVSQESSTVFIDGEKKDLSVTELKNFVLTVLDYPMEFSKKTNLLYRFTVYTMQEEMKQIILQDAKTRLNTLRHIFGVDKYKKVIENSEFITSKLREEARLNQGLIGDLDLKRSLLVDKQDQLIRFMNELVQQEKDFAMKSADRQMIEQEIKSIREKIEERDKLKSELEKTKLLWGSKKERSNSIGKEIEILSTQIKDLSDLPFDKEEISQTEQKIINNRMKKDKISHELIEIISVIKSLSMKNHEFETIKQKMKTIEVCPTCLQDVDELYKQKVFSGFDKQSSEHSEKISELESKRISLNSEIEKINLENSSWEHRLSELRVIKIKRDGINERAVKKSELEDNLKSLERDSEILRGQVDTLEKSIFELSKFENIFVQKNNSLRESVMKEKDSEIKVAETRKGISFLENNISEIESEIKNKENIQGRLSYILEMESWFNDRFIPMISFVERSVMVKLRAEFSKLLDQWFKMLVSDNLSVSLDEEFTPIIEQQGYEMDYAHLSGGERTAIALAYRLALNQVINSLLSRIKTRDLIILDEPTDGFSDQQLDKLRDVFNELNAKQLIIVSHEQKIEGFVENIKRIKKENGIARVIEE